MNLQELESKLAAAKAANDAETIRSLLHQVNAARKAAKGLEEIVEIITENLYDPMGDELPPMNLSVVEIEGGNSYLINSAYLYKVVELCQGKKVWHKVISIDWRNPVKEDGDVTWGYFFCHGEEEGSFTSM